MEKQKGERNPTAAEVYGLAFMSAVHVDDLDSKGRQRTSARAVVHELKPGGSVQAVGGQRYTVEPHGSLRRTDKPRGTKKERRRARQGK